MAIRPIDLQTLYLRMNEVSRQQSKEVKKEERKQSYQNKVALYKEDLEDNSVNQTVKTEAEKAVPEHEKKPVPEPEEQKSQPKGREFSAPPKGKESDHPTGAQEVQDPDLGTHINLEG